MAEAGWRGIKNGELLRLAEVSFDAFLTGDRGLPHQQTIAKLQLGVVVLRIGSTKIDDLRNWAAQIAEALHEVKPGEVLIVTRT